MVANSSKDRAGGVALRRRLVVLLAITVLPFVAFSVFKAQDINDSFRAEYQQGNLALARSVAFSIDDYVLSTGELLEAIARSKASTSGDTEALSAWFADILPDYGHYANLIYVDNDGVIQAAGKQSKDATGPIDVSDTAYYKRSMATTGIALGDFMYGKISGAPVVHVCYPVFDRDGERRGFVAAAMHLTRVQDRLMREKTPEHTTITVMDRAGTVLARNRDAEEWVGTNVYKELRVGDMVARREGEGEATLKDGTQLICAFTEAAAAPWFVRVGVEAEFIGSLVAADVAAHYAVFLPLLLVAIAGWLWIGRDVDLLHRKTEELSLVDALTGLSNSRSLREDLELSIQHAQRSGESLCFAMLDVDDFKQYNDRFGHVAGDEALQAAAHALEGAIRVADRAYRYGGEEFCILMPGTSAEGVAAVTERVRTAVSAVALHHGAQAEPATLSISIGVAAFPDDAQSAGEIMICADAALYQAKRAGKNRVVIHCPERDIHG